MWSIKEYKMYEMELKMSMRGDEVKYVWAIFIFTVFYCKKFQT